MKKVASREVIAAKIAEMNDVSLAEGDRQFRAVSYAIRALLEEGWTTFKFPRLMTIDSRLTKHGAWVDFETGERKETRPKLRVKVKFYDNLRETLREGHNVSSE